MLAPKNRVLLLALLGCALGLGVLPWYAVEDGLFSTEWIGWYGRDVDTTPAVLLAFGMGKLWLAPLFAPFLVALGALLFAPDDRRRAPLLFAAGAVGLAAFLLQGYLIGPFGFTLELASRVWPEFSGRQYGVGGGALCYLAACLAFASEGLAARGWLRGDGFVTGTLAALLAGIGLFIVLPMATIMLRGLEQDDGRRSFGLLLENLASPKLWALTGDRLGTAWSSLLLAVLTGAGSTLLGLGCALAGTRTRLARFRVFNAIAILPIITPPFVLGMALILLFGRSGLFTLLFERALGIPASRGLYGLPGLLAAQLLAFTPVAYLVLRGALEAASPTLEEAASTLGAGPGRIFYSVTLPLLRPALANAFLVGFIESLADFGNPLMLAGSSFEVLATEVYFAVAGAEANIPKAAAMALVLLLFTLLAFWAQERWVKKGAYAAVGGKGDAGLRAPLPPGIGLAVNTLAIGFVAATLVLYAVVAVGGFVQTLGRDMTPTLAHYADAFRVSLGDGGLNFSGGAWRSLASSFVLSAIAAPLTALFGILTAYVLARQSFRGKAAIELAAMLSFAVPGTVVGVAYVLTFNEPPFELTGTAAIIVLAFLFRNMPVGIRAGLAGLSQLDPSLDEASLTLGAGTARTLRRVVLPLLRPAVATALVYGFARAMTAVSAVVFLVSAEHGLATTYILGRVEAGDYGPAIAYASVLIASMLLVILAIQKLVGTVQIGRRSAG